MQCEKIESQVCEGGSRPVVRICRIVRERQENSVTQDKRRGSKRLGKKVSYQERLKNEGNDCPKAIGNRMRTWRRGGKE